MCNIGLMLVCLQLFFIRDNGCDTQQSMAASSLIHKRQVKKSKNLLVTQNYDTNYHFLKATRDDTPVPRLKRNEAKFLWAKWLTGRGIEPRSKQPQCFILTTIRSSPTYMLNNTINSVSFCFAANNTAVCTWYR